VGKAKEGEGARFFGRSPWTTLQQTAVEAQHCRLLGHDPQPEGCQSLVHFLPKSLGVRAGLISPAELVEKGHLPRLSDADYVELAIRRLEPEAGAFMLAVIKRMVDKANAAWERMPEHLQVQVTTAGIEPPQQINRGRR
jgi:hypothetical protein